MKLTYTEVYELSTAEEAKHDRTAIGLSHWRRHES